MSMCEKLQSAWCVAWMSMRTEEYKMFSFFSFLEFIYGISHVENIHNSCGAHIFSSTISVADQSIQILVKCFIVDMRITKYKLKYN